MRVAVYLLSLVFSMDVYSSTIENSRGNFYKIPESYIKGEGSGWGDTSPLLSLAFDSEAIKLNSYYGIVSVLVFYDKDYERLGGDSCPLIRNVVDDYERRVSDGVVYYYEKSGRFDKYYYSPVFSGKSFKCDSSKDYLAMYRPAKDFVAGNIVSKGVDGCKLFFNHDGMAVNLHYNGSECRYEKYADVVESFRVLMDSWKLHKE